MTGDLVPIELPLRDEGAAWNKRWSDLAWLFVGLGIAIRLLRYLLNFPLWGDELMLAENLLDRSYAELTLPLENRQCAPLLFLGVELTAVKLLGFSEWSLRLFPVACAISGIVLFRHLASRILSGLPLLLSVAILAVAFHPIRHSTEVKPYASDLTLSLLLITLAVEWLRQPQQVRWLWLLAAAGPLAIGLSFPAAFVAGGISLGLAWRAWQGGWRTRMALATYNVVIVAGFGFFAWLSLAGQFQQTGRYMQDYWARSFPPLTQPLALLGWLWTTHTGELFAYPYGGERCGSILTTACCAVGAWLLWRRRQYPLLGMFGGIFFLAFIAAAIKRYPYGDTARLVQYVAPPICLLAGLGWAVTIVRLRTAAQQWRGAIAAIVVLLIGGLGQGAFQLIHPYKYRSDYLHRGFAQWFWTQRLAGGETAAVPAVVGLSERSRWDRAAFRCLQRIYGQKPAASVRQAASAANTAPARPIRFVWYGSSDDRRDEVAVAAWLEDMQTQYDYVGHDRFAVDLTVSGRAPRAGAYEVYEFVPRGAAAAVAEVPKGTTLR